MTRQSYRILHIEDDAADIAVVSRLLRRVRDFDVEVVAKQTPDAGLKELMESEVDCVLLDYRLGATDGLAVLSRIRHINPYVPIVFVTGEGNEYVAIEALRRGAQEYQVKSSLTSRSLQQAIQSALRISKQERLLEQQRRELIDFVSVVAHDLQQPLCAVKGNIELVRDFYSANLDPAGQEFIHSAVRMTERMSRMIDSLLSYARAGGGQRQRQPVDLNRVMENVVSSLSELIRSRSAEVVVSPLPTAMGDESTLTQLLQNLVANGIKFTEKKPRIEVTGTIEEGECVVQVRDNGIGIPADHTETIFEPFKRLHSRKRFEGSGIGLATCRRIVENHDGRIGVESIEGEGTMFWFAVPARSEQQAGGPRILIADSEESSLRRLAAALEGGGYETTSARKLLDVARVLQDSEVDLLITDVRLADGSCVDLIHEARQREPAPAVLALSGGTETESPGHLLALAHQAGANGVLSKPVSEERLLETVAKLLKEKENEAAVATITADTPAPGLKSAGEGVS